MDHKTCICGRVLVKHFSGQGGNDIYWTLDCPLHGTIESGKLSDKEKEEFNDLPL